MGVSEHILLLYGYLLLFAWILVGQLGLPLPATPVLLTTGALTTQHELSFTLALLAALAASLMADSVWFLIGRRYGSYVLNLLCKLSLEPTVCVHRTQNTFKSRSGATLLVAKFVPGLATLASSVAGQRKMNYLRFLFFDGIGTTLWVGALMGAGHLFGDLLKRNNSLLNWVENFSGALLLLGILGFLVARLVRRRLILKSLAAARIEPEELKRRLDVGEEVFIVDLRDLEEMLLVPFTLPGAHLFSPQTLAARNREIPRDREIVLFCSCPSETTAAKTAMTLHRLGIERVRPLRGGYDAWKQRGFPLHAVEPSLLVRE